MRLLSLLSSQVLLGVLSGLVVAELFGRTESQSGASSLARLAVLICLPFVFTAPLQNGVVRWLPNGNVRIAVYAAAGIVALFCALSAAPDNNSAWLLVLAIQALGLSLLSPSYESNLAGAETAIPLNRLLGWHHAASAAGLAGGIALRVGSFDHSTFWDVAALNFLIMLAGVPERFHAQSDRPAAKHRPFIIDCRAILSLSEARADLLALAISSMLCVGGACALFGRSYSQNADFTVVLAILFYLSLGFISGSLASSIQWHPRRCLGLVPLGGCFTIVGLAWAALSAELRWPAIGVGFGTALIMVPAGTDYKILLETEQLLNGHALANLLRALAASAVLALELLASDLIGLSAQAQLWLLDATAALCTFLLARAFKRELIEQISEMILSACYRIHAHGPGLNQVPLRGPVLVVANHAAWFDPLWLGKFIPRPIYPMMTSRFYDVPGLRWLMTQVVQAIRVPEATFRRQAPELDEAVAVLDRGQCLLIFPEGAMRRKEEVPLRQFGQGVWRILQQRPSTPVVACWIEGGWGSFFSYRNGPPTKNKSFDIWRAIDIGFGPIQVLPAELHNDQRAARAYLMEACLEARRCLQLAGVLSEEVEAPVPGLNDSPV
jgi:1-acyl-sn-glycerol-3-phosphate acyltransferase